MSVVPSLSSAPPIGTIMPRFLSPSIFAGLMASFRCLGLERPGSMVVSVPSRSTKVPRAITSRMRCVSSSTRRSASAPGRRWPFRDNLSKVDMLDVNGGSASSSGRPLREQLRERLAERGGPAHVHREEGALRVVGGEAAAAVGSRPVSLSRGAPLAKYRATASAAEYASSPSSTGKADHHRPCTRASRARRPRRRAGACGSRGSGRTRAAAARSCRAARARGRVRQGVAQMQVKHSGLAAHEACDVAVGREPREAPRASAVTSGDR